MDRSIIGTSTSYCPNCWELLGILRRKATDFTVHNHHTTLSHVQLPPWVPQDVMMEMLDQFKQILLHQIIAMIEKQVREKHAQSFYQQSGMRGGRPTFDSLYSDGESDNGDWFGVAGRLDVLRSPDPHIRHIPTTLLVNSLSIKQPSHIIINYILCCTIMVVSTFSHLWWIIRNRCEFDKLF